MNAAAAGKYLELAALLPPPPGVNHTYRSTAGGRWYKSAAAVIWQDKALLALRAAGFRPQGPGCHWVQLRLVLFTVALDCDGPAKIAADTIFFALDVDDRWLGQLTITKVLVRHRNEQRLDVRARIRPVKDKAEFTAQSIESLAHSPIEC